MRRGFLSGEALAGCFNPNAEDDVASIGSCLRAWSHQAVDAQRVLASYSEWLADRKFFATRDMDRDHKNMPGERVFHTSDKV